jgi:ribonuclease D
MVPRHLAGSRRRRFEEAAGEGLRVPEAEWPERIRRPRLRPTSEQTRLFNHYKTERDKAAALLALDPSIIAPKAAIEAVASNPAEAHEKLMPWQRALLGIAD